RLSRRSHFSVLSLFALASLDKLLTAVDVVGSAGESRVRHEVDGERRYIGSIDDSADRQRRAKLVPSLSESVAEQRRRQWRVDNAGRDEVDADRREFERKHLRERGEAGGERRGERHPYGWAAAACSADQKQRSSRPHFGGRVAGDV